MPSPGLYALDGVRGLVAVSMSAPVSTLLRWVGGVLGACVCAEEVWGSENTLCAGWFVVVDAWDR